MSKKLLLLATVGLVGAGILAIQPALAHENSQANSNVQEKLRKHHERGHKKMHDGLKDKKHASKIEECLKLTPEEFSQCIDNHHNERLQHLLDEGKITEDQATSLRERHEQHKQRMINKFLN